MGKIKTGNSRSTRRRRKRKKKRRGRRRSERGKRGGEAEVGRLTRAHQLTVLGENNVSMKRRPNLLQKEKPEMNNGGGDLGLDLDHPPLICLSCTNQRLPTLVVAITTTVSIKGA
jgi:hypothetical protein